jgi:NitT/TauT family transport system substrate-binding protein
MPETCLALTKGANIQPVGYLIKEPLNSLIYRTGEGINAPKDFNDKIVGYVLGSFGLKFLRVLLAQNDIHVSDTLRVNFDLVSTLGTNRVDIIYGAYWNIEGEHLRSLGVDTNHVTLHELGLPKYFELLILANSKSQYANPEFIDRFKLALQESIDYSVQNPDEAYNLYLSANPDKGNQAIAWERVAWQKTIPVLAKNQNDEVDVWDDFCLWAKKHDIIPSDAATFHIASVAP